MELHAPPMQPIINGVKQPVIIRQSQPSEIIPIFIPFIFATWRNQPTLKDIFGRTRRKENQNHMHIDRERNSTEVEPWESAYNVESVSQTTH